MFPGDFGTPRFPRKLRRNAYQGLGVKGWGVSSAYITIAAQIIDKLELQYSSPYFKLHYTRQYLAAKNDTWGAIASEYDDAEFRPMAFLKKLVTSVSQWAEIPPKLPRN